MTNQPRRILSVEDDTAIAELLGIVLAAEGYDVQVVQTGAEALSKLESQSYDAVLLDLELPDMEGAAILRHIRMKDAGGMLPVIVNSGYRSRMEDVEGMATAVLPKPTDITHLADVLRRFVGHSNGSSGRASSASSDSESEEMPRAGV
jgi:DNA-binding response OmpR family regulator